jgi:FtsH-binding integral membrane protein
VEEVQLPQFNNQEEYQAWKAQLMQPSESGKTIKNNALYSEFNVIKDELSEGIYNFIIGIVLFWGFILNLAIVQGVPYESLVSVNPWSFFIGYFVSCIAGIIMFKLSDNPAVSFIGYNLVVVPFGLVVNLVVHQYDPALVVNAMRVTCIVTLFMMVLASIFPAFFTKLGGVLFIALLAVIIVELIEIFIFGVHHGILDWIVAIIFCGYIGYDWSRANSIPRTLDNAIDSAAALYMDIINLFLRVLRIMGEAEE